MVGRSRLNPEAQHAILALLKGLGRPPTYADFASLACRLGHDWRSVERIWLRHLDEHRVAQEHLYGRAHA